MGVPKFYRWISERYPLINQIISDSTVLPEIDNLYLDMNGIIHACTHPNDQDTSKTLTMREMMLGIFRYIDRMVSEIVRPKKILFMAIDGVAPRAKLNQQRARRFRSAQDREDNLIKARQRGEIIDESILFDSNCITPGTEFMESVGKHLRWFIRKKIKEDPVWRNLQIIFSGHDVPGEGEHKIMEFIREERNKPSYEPNQRHCMYGQDADLIMLGLASHEPHFTLLREVVQFNVKPSNSSRQTVIRQTKEVQFQLLHISVLREYIEVDLALGCKWDVHKERLIDDFILLTFLVGNDFLPHLPTLDISEHAFDVIFDAYKELLLSEPGYIVKEGVIDDLTRLEKLFHKIGEQEDRILQTREEDVKHMNAKRSKRSNLFSNLSMLSAEELEEVEEQKQAEYEHAIMEALGKSTSALSVITSTTTNSSVVDHSMASLVKDYRGRYYYEKFKMILRVSTTEGNEELDRLMLNYLQGLMWCLAYYVKGCISWKWYYPYHYGPMLQDMKNLSRIASQIQFELGEPFKPFQQLLGCLPPLSKSLVPLSYQWLMTNPNSPVLEFYPTNFSVDQDGKKNPWEAVVLLPFIDEKRLFEAESMYCNINSLSLDEIPRNLFGNILWISFDPNVMDTYPSCNPAIQLPDINQCQSKLIEKSFSLLPGPPFKAEIIEGTNTFVAGFPSLGALPIANVTIDFMKVNVFGGDSKYRSVILELENKITDPNTFDIKILLGRSVYVNYPTFHEARVVAVTTESGEYRLVKTLTLPSTSSSSNDQQHHSEKKKSIVVQIGESVTKQGSKPFTGTIIGPIGDGTETICYQSYDSETSRQWINESESESKRYLKGRGLPGSAGLNINRIVIRIRVHVLQGMKLDIATGSRRKVFGTNEADIPLQLAAWTPLCLDMRFQETEALSIEKFMPYGSEIIAISGKYKGLRGKVVGPHGPSSDPHSSSREKTSKKKGSSKRTVDVEFEILSGESPFGYAISLTITDQYFTSRDICRACDIHPQVLGMIVGSLFVEPGRHDIGLNLKKNGQYQLYEYIRRIESQQETITPMVAWTQGDSVHVVGSTSNEDDNGDNGLVEKSVWEYSEKTIALVKAYKAKFPTLFSNLARIENAKNYMIQQLIKPKENETPESVIEQVMSWMKAQPFYTMQRTPLTTICMSLAAMKAIEKAEDVRVAQLKVTPPERMIVKDTPVETVFRGELHSSNDAPLSFNDSSPPRLGDRVVNLIPSQAPFGLRGTVIVVHKATRFVEVIFDEEFVGGKSLQGYCSQFRGRLCSWSSLLRVSTDAEWSLVMSRVKNVSYSSTKTTQPVRDHENRDHDTQVNSKSKKIPSTVNVKPAVSMSPLPGRRVTDLLKTSLAKDQIPLVPSVPSVPLVQQTQPVSSSHIKVDSEMIGHAPAHLGGFRISKKATKETKELLVKSTATDGEVIGHAPAKLGGFRIMKKPSTAPSVSSHVSQPSIPVVEHTTSTTKLVSGPKLSTSEVEETLSKLSIVRSNGTGLSALSAAAGNTDLISSDAELPHRLPTTYVGYVPHQPPSSTHVFPPQHQQHQGLMVGVDQSRNSTKLAKKQAHTGHTDNTHVKKVKESKEIKEPKETKVDEVHISPSGTVVSIAATTKSASVVSASAPASTDRDSAIAKEKEAAKNLMIPSKVVVKRKMNAPSVVSATAI